jgi:hypothetical protein
MDFPSKPNSLCIIFFFFFFLFFFCSSAPVALVPVCIFWVYIISFSFSFVKALDRVIEEARRQGIRLILSLANNLDAYGGKSQYVKWAWEEGVGMSASNDSFFFDPSIKSYFKSYLKVNQLISHLFVHSFFCFLMNGFGHNKRIASLPTLLSFLGTKSNIYSVCT